MPPRQYVVLAAALTAVCSHVSAIVITTPGAMYQENFDSLAGSGAGSVLPGLWQISESGTQANGSYVAGTGSGLIGDTYSFGSSGSTDRALGTLRSGSLVPLFGVEIRNATGGSIDELEIGFMGEQWRLGFSDRADRLDFQFSTDPLASLTSGEWLDFDLLDFVSPVTTGLVGARDGNDPAHRVSLAASLVGLSLGHGSSLWLRWVDFDASRSDDGLAIDDFRVTAHGPASAPPRSVPDAVPTAGCLAALVAGMVLLRSRRRELASCPAVHG